MNMSGEELDTISFRVNEDQSTVVEYFCENAVENDPILQVLPVPYYYELVFPCEEETSDEGREFVAAALLVKARQQYLSDPSICTTPTNPWFGAISSDPADGLAPLACTESVGNNTQVEDEECCVVVAGNMTFTELSVTENLDSVKLWIADTLQESNVAPGYGVTYLGAQLPEDEDRAGFLDPAINDEIEAPRKAPPEDSEFTVTGGFVLGMLILMVVGIFLFIYQRRKKFLQNDFGLAVSESHATAHETREERVDPAEIQNLIMVARRLPGGGGATNDSIEQTAEDEETAGTSSIRMAQKYRMEIDEIDQGHYQHSRNNVGGYGGRRPPTSVTASSSSNAFDHLSESDVDSWAQPDGTLGSLAKDRRALGGQTDEI